MAGDGVHGLPEVAAWVAGFDGRAVPRAPEELAALRELYRVGLAAMGEQHRG